MKNTENKGNSEYITKYIENLNPETINPDNFILGWECKTIINLAIMNKKYIQSLYNEIKILLILGCFNVFIGVFVNFMGSYFGTVNCILGIILLFLAKNAENKLRKAKQEREKINSHAFLVTELISAMNIKI